MGYSLLLAAVFAALAVAAPAPAPELDSRQATWQQYVRAKSSRIPAVAIVPGSVTGNVANAAGLLTGGQTLLTRTLQQGPGCLTLDFGINTAGKLSLDFAFSSVFSASGAQRPGLTLAFSETLQYLGEADFTRSDNQDASSKVVPDRLDHIAVAAGAYTWTNSFGCQYPNNKVCSDGLHGFRYVKICIDSYSGDSDYTVTNGQVAITGAHVNYEGFLGTADTFTGSFECSDSALTQWWYDGVYTNDLVIDTFLANDTEPRGAASPSLIGKQVILDGAKRDRDPYVGDIAVSALTAYLSHNVAQAAVNVLADLADHQRSDGWIPPASINNYGLQLFDYPLHWVKSVHDLTYYTGNTDFINKYYPNLVKLLDTYYPSATDPTDNLLLRPSGYGDYAFISREGSITYYNAYYVTVLRLASDLAQLTGHASDGTRWNQRADVVAAKLLSRNWDSSVGAFYDGAQCILILCNTHSQDGNSFAILANIGDTSHAESALRYMASNMALPYGNAFFDNGFIDSSYNSRVYAFVSYWEIAARFETPSAIESAFEEIRRLYGWMASHDPGVTHWEGIGSGGNAYEGGFTSMAHGWSTGITPLLSTYVLGAKPTSPGFATWEVKPTLGSGGLTWAKGDIPTPFGPISISWDLTQLVVASPETTTGVVSIRTESAVLVDGKPLNLARDASNSTGYVNIPHNGGRHVYTFA